MNRTRIAAAGLAAALLAGCGGLLAALVASPNYGEACESDEDCTSGLRCLETPRAENPVCLTHEPVGAGDPCTDFLECESGLRCDLGSGTCQSSGLGLPECDDDGDCASGEVCRDATCVER